MKSKKDNYVNPRKQLEKICKKCKILKPREDFYFSNKEKTSVRGECKLCNHKKTVLFNQNNTNRRWTILKNKYGISRKEYEDILQIQNNQCKICQSNFKDKKRIAIHLDHCHITSKVRGILCNRCNILIGLAKDNIQILERAKEYLCES